MAIYNFSAQIISRSDGRSAIASAAYRSCSKIKDYENGTTKNYKRKTEVAYSTIMLPPNAPADYSDREILWNEVHKVEKNSNAQLARDFEIALPMELSLDENIKLIKDYCQKQFVDEGMIADINIHNKKGNPHAHVMVTMRAFDENGKWLPKERKVYALDEYGNKIPILDSKGNQKIEKKTGRKLWERISIPTNNWNNQDNMEKWRASWAVAINERLQCQAVDHRSFKRQGKDIMPTIHLGVAANILEKRGVATEKGNHNRKVAIANAAILQRKLEMKKIAEEIQKLQLSAEAEIPVREMIAVLPQKSSAYRNLYRIYVNDRKATITVPKTLRETISRKQKIDQEQLREITLISAAARRNQRKLER